MANENENSNSEIEAINLDEISDIDVLKEHYQKLDGTYREISDKNKQLFERTKKAEGFELKDGKWVKPEAKPKAEPKGKVEHEPSKEPSKPSELDYGQMALLRGEGIKGAGETALFKEIMSETGKDVLATLDSPYFKTRLTEFREAQESKDAIPKGKNRSGQQGTTDLDVAYAKFKDTGEMPQDFKTRVAVKNKMLEEEKAKNMFSGPSVIGPQVQQY